jgi:hypothetical protein
MEQIRFFMSKTTKKSGLQKENYTKGCGEVFKFDEWYGKPYVLADVAHSPAVTPEPSSCIEK